MVRHFIAGFQRFLSTLPAWGATGFPPLSPVWDVISIHAPRVGSDSMSPSPPSFSVSQFLSTLPAWGATCRGAGRTREESGISIHAPRVGSDITSAIFVFIPFFISIHAPRVGSDPSFSATHSPQRNFYPRSPRGERPAVAAVRRSRASFLSTLPAWGATQISCRLLNGNAFLSTLPAWGATLSRTPTFPGFTDFYPRSPRGERRPLFATLFNGRAYFYPRSPRGERPMP